MRAIAPQIEDRGIDEIYIDLTERAGRRTTTRGARAGARRSRHAVREATGLSCSIGVTPNKLLAKIASELDKPDGLTLLTHGRPRRRASGRCRRARSTASARRRREARSARHRHHRRARARRPGAGCVEHFGRSYGAWLHDAAHGRDERAGGDPQRADVDQPRDDLRARPARRCATAPSSARSSPSCASSVADDLARKGYVGKTIGIKLRFDNFKTVTRDLTHRRADRRRARDPPRRRRVPEARRR